MFFYLLFTLLFAAIYFTNAHVIVWTHTRDTYNRIQTLTGIVKRQHKNIFVIAKVSAQIILKSLTVSFFQFLNRNMRQLDKNTYELSYVVQGRLYKMLIKVKRGPRSVIQIIDEEGNDVSDHIYAYMGPMENFHGHKELTPAHLGRNTLTFFLDDGSERTFEKEHKIDI
jgi:hypothetical protein